MAAFYINNSSGVLVRVERVDSSYAYLTILGKLQSSYAMPRAVYDSTFVYTHRPANLGEVTPEAEKMLPANAPDEWKTSVLATPVAADPEPQSVTLASGAATFTLDDGE